MLVPVGKNMPLKQKGLSRYPSDNRRNNISYTNLEEVLLGFDKPIPIYNPIKEIVSQALAFGRQLSTESCFGLTML